ncbi:uncharacterized protein LOC105445862 [Strongylocentrotus purpuratus]|uniref:Uncharacterized protein n=1 Tax=Strongylocentrotus purpuratus TaxID=7668 RepID=A0A7M7SZ75_STRPU|nr:uncharacterized protein LOC105445862 [Strongylocentrotus purpuratus]
MLKVLFHSLTGGFKILILFIFIILTNLYGCKSTQLSKIQGQEANLIFPYPCDSTKVSLQHSYRVPFYSSTDGLSLSLSQDQVQRYNVQNRNNTENCSLGFTISNLLSIDQGTYILSVYKDGEILVEQTHRIWLQVDYPPGKASCVVSDEKGGDWVSIDCTANVGSLSGEIECYQDRVWMPPLSDPIETRTLLKQTILIRKSQPVFCCSSTLIEYKERIECNDTALYLAGNNSTYPSPLTSTATTRTLNDITETTETQSYMVSNTTISMKENYVTSVIIHSVFVCIEVILLLFIVSLIYKKKKGFRTCVDKQKSSSQAVLMKKDDHIKE